MKAKTTMKGKKKASYAKSAPVRRLKSVQPVTGAKSYSLKPMAGGSYGGAYKAAEMHDALGAYPEAETTPQDHETELAEKLVGEISDRSPDVNALCETYKLRREELGRLTGFSLRALAEWASGKLPSQPAQRRLHEVRRLLDALAEIVKRERIPKWLHQSNPAFGRLTPLQVIELGEIDRLWAMVYDLGSGQPS